MIIYGRPYSAGSKIIKPLINIAAAQSFGFYKPYQYCSAHVSDKPMPLAKYITCSKSGANEGLTRFRRLVLFSYTAGLAPVKRSASSKRLIDRVLLAGSTDHVTYWQGPLGANFILNEPYSVDPDYLPNLDRQGLAAIVVPADLSPYCGGWDAAAHAKPGTTSYLICDQKDAGKLPDLERMSLNLPCWNSTGGIHHV